MKTYKVIASYITYCTAEIEAGNETEAWILANNMDGGDFDPDQYNDSDWKIEEITEVQA